VRNAAIIAKRNTNAKHPTKKSNTNQQQQYSNMIGFTTTTTTIATTLQLQHQRTLRGVSDGERDVLLSFVVVLRVHADQRRFSLPLPLSPSLSLSLSLSLPLSLSPSLSLYLSISIVLEEQYSPEPWKSKRRSGAGSEALKGTWEMLSLTNFGGDGSVRQRMEGNNKQ